MKKSSILAIGALALILSCSKENPNEISEPSTNLSGTQKVLSVSEINKHIEGELKQNGDMNWTTSPAVVLWSAVMNGNGILSVGYGNKGESFSNKRSVKLNDARENIYTIVQSIEGVSKSSSIVSADEILNVTELKITKLETIEALQKASHIRYLEPIGYGAYLQEKEPNQQKSAGCNRNNESINSADYRVISPNARLPWNFDIHKIPQAWNYSTGAGITVGLIDTGISASQNLLGGGFNDGASNGRTVERLGTYIDSANDQCGHGTSMAGALAAPRNDDAMPVGAAYNCNLVAYRATEDVVLDDYDERKGVSNALKALGNRSDVKIISMSIGYPWSIGVVKDAVKYAYRKGKMIVAAGGTSTRYTNWVGVIFPANMSETVAVTGIRNNKYEECNICHYGRKIDFTIVMEKADSDRHIPVIGFNTGTQSYVGGSSVATATTAGIAALVWARNPSMTRSQVLDKLKKSGEFYPNRNRTFGYGNINALKAVK
ncbi:S8/S53 family peptidase [Aquimarina longa]|uniref:S8/S53 family peptidase n=1 Tax=Aquimarina longa TaxID=1080221 RepID=UPI000785BD7F|nr:S8/S53 family peptidase [Aquimarina longa]